MSLRNQGRLETSSWLQHGRLGFNYRLDDLSAALGIGQLEKLDRILAARRAVAARYGELLAGVDVETPLADDADHVRSWFVYVVKLPAASTATRSCARLADQGIATAPYLPSIHLQSYMRERWLLARGCCRSARTAARARWRSRSTRGSTARDQERVVETRSAQRSSDPRSARGRHAPHGLPRLRQVRALRPDLRARADRRRARLRRPHARVGRGIPEPIVASRTERAILAEMGVVPGRTRPAPQDENLFSAGGAPPLQSADARPILALRLANRQYLEWTEPDRDEPDARYTLEGIEGWVTRHERAFVILDGAEIVGTISLFNVTGRPALSGMIGYWVDQRRAGRGLATAAVAAILEVAWRDLGLHRVEAGTRADNAASQRVLEKNGFTRVGLLDATC